MPTTGGENRVHAVAESFTTPLARAYGLTAPTDVYPLYENATRAAWGMSFADAQAESAEPWSGMSCVAAGNPDRWITAPVTAEQAATASADNRLVSYPYASGSAITVDGGLTFGGGPIDNCMSHAAAAMTLRLRNSRGRG